MGGRPYKHLKKPPVLGLWLLTILYALYSFNLVAAVKPVAIPLNKWSSQRVISTAFGQVLEQKGWQVKYQNIDADSQWGALSRGVVHFQIEVWQPSMAHPYEKFVKTGHIIELGTHSVTIREEWWYPKYVEALCPELPDWRALNRCWRLFSDTADSKKGIYYSGPWDYSDGDIIRALDLNFTIERLPDSQAIWAKLAAAFDKQQPILLLNWSPNWTDRHIKGEFIEFPPYTPECEQEPSWGINKRLAKDCGNRKGNLLKKAAWSGLERHAKCVMLMLQRLDLNHEMIVEAASLSVVQNFSDKDAAQLWRQTFGDAIAPWTSLPCAPDQ